MEHNLTVMIVEDDPYIQRLCAIILQEEKYQVLQAHTGNEALTLFNDSEPDIILLDLGLPDIDGTELLPLSRASSAAPIIILSARGEETEKIRALDLGADDYMSKPFHTGELMARIRVAARRISTPAPAEGEGFDFDGLHVDFLSAAVTLNGETIHLTAIEYKLLCLLVRNQGKVLTHNYLRSQIWGTTDERDAQNLRVFMASLRRKLNDVTVPYRYISTQVGIGYRFASR